MSSMTKDPTSVAPGLEILRRTDIPALAALELILFPDDAPWTEEMFHSEIDGGNHYFVHRDGEGEIDGYAGLAVLGSEAEVHNIAVRPQSQGNGIGRKLLRQLLSVAGNRRVLLEVRTDNLPATALYESEGFTIVGIRRRYYRPSGADAYTMARPR